jgi:hypothetical protein
MQALWGLIGAAVMWAIRSGAADILVSLGIGIATFTGVESSLGWLKTEFLNQFSGLPSQMVSVLSYMKVGVALNILFSASIMRLTLKGMTSGAFKSWRIK